MKTKAADCSAAFFIVQNAVIIAVIHLFKKYIINYLESARKRSKFARFIRIINFKFQNITNYEQADYIRAGRREGS